MKRREGCLLGFIVICVFVMMIFMTLSMLTERNREAAMARIPNPPSLIAHKKLAAELASEDPQLSEEEVAVLAAENPFPEDAAEIVAAWKGLFVLLEGGPKQLEETDYGPEKWSDEDVEEIKVFFRENPDLIESIRLMAARGGPIMEVDIAGGWEEFTTGLLNIRQCARTLRAHAAISALDGISDEVVSDVTGCLQLIDAMSNKPFLVSQIMRLSVGDVATGAISESISHGGNLSADQTAELMDMLEGARNRQAFADGLASEGAFMIQSMSEGSKKSMIGWVAKPFINANATTCAELMGDLVQAAELPYYEAREQLDQFSRDVGDLGWTRHLARTTLPGLYRAPQSQAHHEALIDLTRVGLQLERYQAEHGSYPGSLDAVAPRLGGTVPVDIYTGEPFHYIPSDDTFTLYSVGMNLRDDNGRHDPGGGDIVWRGVTEKKE